MRNFWGLEQGRGQHEKDVSAVTGKGKGDWARGTPGGMPEGPGEQEAPPCKSFRPWPPSHSPSHTPRQGGLAGLPRDTLLCGFCFGGCLCTHMSVHLCFTPCSFIVCSFAHESAWDSLSSSVSLEDSDSPFLTTQMCPSLGRLPSGMASSYCALCSVQTSGPPAHTSVCLLLPPPWTAHLADGYHNLSPRLSTEPGIISTQSRFVG